MKEYTLKRDKHGWVVMPGADLTRANLQGAILKGANLYSANIEGADLGNANLQSAVLVNARLEGANLEGANLIGADLDGANLLGANLDYSVWPLWCGSRGVIVDRRIAVQLIAHVCALVCDDPEVQAAQKALLPLARTSHVAKDLGLL